MQAKLVEQERLAGEPAGQEAGASERGGRVRGHGAVVEAERRAQRQSHFRRHVRVRAAHVDERAALLGVVVGDQLCHRHVVGRRVVRGDRLQRRRDPTMLAQEVERLVDLVERSQAEEVHLFIRRLIGEVSGNAAANTVRVLYGGSVTPENIDSLMKEPDIDGALVGGASLKTESFARIINFL